MTDYKLSRLDLLAFIGIVAFASWFLLKQLFVYPDYRPAPINFRALLHRSVPTGEVDNNAAAAIVICQPECNFVVGEKIIPARLANDSAGQLRQLNLNFVDTKRGLIGYDNASQGNPEFYVLSFDKELIQVIQLDLNHQRTLKFAGYYPATGQIGFKSSDGNNWLYSAASPSLIRR